MPLGISMTSYCCHYYLCQVSDALVFMCDPSKEYTKVNACPIEKDFPSSNLSTTVFPRLAV